MKVAVSFETDPTTWPLPRSPLRGLRRQSRPLPGPEATEPSALFKKSKWKRSGLCAAPGTRGPGARVAVGKGGLVPEPQWVVRGREARPCSRCQELARHGEVRLA